MVAAGVAGGTAAGFAAGVSMAAFSGASLGDAMRAGARGAFAGAVFGGIGGYYGDVWNASRVATNSLAGGITSKANGGNFNDGLRLALVTSLVRVGWEKMRMVTNAHKLNACSQAGQPDCVYNSRGELMTFSNRGTEQIPGTEPGNGNFITRMTENSADEGFAFGNKSGLLARSGNTISKAHDWWNSDFSKMFGFHGYNQSSGLVMQGGELYNTSFQLWSLGGMVPSAAYSGVAMSASAPYLYEMEDY